VTEADNVLGDKENDGNKRENKHLKCLYFSSLLPGRGKVTAAHLRKISWD
jgi:hypothetical protein